MVWGVTEVLVIATDRSRHRKHGQMRSGAGVYIIHNNRTIASKSYGISRKTNGYDGESFALTAGIVMALQYCTEHTYINRIIFFTDSASAIKNIMSTRPHPSQNISNLFIKHAKKFLKNTDNSITIQWIPSHSNIKINEQADKLAKKGCRIQEELLNNTITFHSECKSKLVTKCWQKEFRLAPQNNLFWDVTSTLPSTKTDKIFRQLQNKPEIFGRLTQVQMMHGYNTSYYQHFNIDRDRDCICNHYLPPLLPSRIRNHILHNCEHYDEHRHILSEVLRDHDPTILLRTVKGLIAMAEFLKISGAFTSDGTPYIPPKPPELRVAV